MKKILDILIVLAIFEIPNAYKLKRKGTVVLFLGQNVLIKIITAVQKQLSIIWESKKRWRCEVLEILWAKISGQFHGPWLPNAAESDKQCFSDFNTVNDWMSSLSLFKSYASKHH